MHNWVPCKSDPESSDSQTFYVEHESCHYKKLKWKTANGSPLPWMIKLSSTRTPEVLRGWITDTAKSVNTLGPNDRPNDSVKYFKSIFYLQKAEKVTVRRVDGFLQVPTDHPTPFLHVWHKGMMILDLELLLLAVQYNGCRFLDSFFVLKCKYWKRCCFPGLSERIGSIVNCLFTSSTMPDNMELDF